MSTSFISHADKALVDIKDDLLKDALRSGLFEHHELLDTYVDTYKEITGQRWSRDSLCTFFCGWRSPDGAAHAVSSITVRLLHEASARQSSHDKLLLLEAAANCGHIIVEDIGLGEMHGHTHHSELYYQMATRVCGTDVWLSRQTYLDPRTREFSSWVKTKRPLAKDLAEAIEMMMLTEFFNTAEYNLMTPMFKDWMQFHHGMSRGEALRTASFLSVHCGDVEASHFRHAGNVLTLYASATGQELDYDRIARLSSEYVVRACGHLATMRSVLVAA